MDLEKLEDLTLKIKDTNNWLSSGLFALGVKDIQKNTEVYNFILYSVVVAFEKSSQLADDLFDAVREK